MTDQTQMALPVARRLAGLGAERGAFQILVNAAAQRQAAKALDRAQWTPSGFIPLRERPAPHLTAANDEHADPSSTTA